MNYLLLSDCLWYCGHILTGISGVLSKEHYEIAVSFVFIGQFITIISRPIGRINNENIKVKNVNDDEIVQIV